MATYQNVVDLARIPLNDEDKDRYSDTTLMSYANVAVLSLFQHRPDIFIGQYASIPTGEAALSDPFPVPAAYLVTLADYVTARTSMIDDEHANTGKAAEFMRLLAGEIS